MIRLKQPRRSSNGNDNEGGNNTNTSSSSNKNNKNNNNKVSALFEEILGENASAIGSTINGGMTKGEDSTQMSSILGPIFKGIQAQHSNPNNNNNTTTLGNIPEEQKASREYVLNINSANNGLLNQMKKQQNQTMMEEEYTQTNDEDTYMTKPREILFDQNDDDVSALFGGHGGASMSGNGVESYMGTFAAQRKNRQKGQQQQQQQQYQSGGGGDRGRGRNNNSRGGRRQQQPQDKSTLGVESTLGTGVTSILEEIGLRSMASRKKKKIKKGSVSSDSESEGDDDDDENNNDEGGRGGGGRNKSKTRGRSRGRDTHTDHNHHHNHHHRSSKKEKGGLFCGIKSKTWTILLVGIMFVTIQFTTVRKRDKAAMTHLNWRFNQNNRQYAMTSGGKNGVEIVEGSSSGGRRRREFGGMMYNSENNPDGLGDVLRKTVPLLNNGLNQKQHNNNNVGGGGWEEDEIMMDDGIGVNPKLQPNLRGGGGGSGGNGQYAAVNKPLQQHQQQQQRQVRQQQQQVQTLVLPQQQQQQQRQRQVQQVQQQQVQQQVQQQPQQNSEAALGNTHPLLTPQKGLSMAAALDKLKGPASSSTNSNNNDKLSDIDPRPQQQLLSNDIIPRRFNVFADLRTPYIVGRDTPFFWHIPRSGGVVVKTMLSHCLGQTLAAEVGELEGHGGDTELKVISFAEHNYTNVNIATPEGINRAINLGLVPSHISNTIVSAHVDLVPSLFNANDRARAFALFRHPIDRATSMFYFLKGTGYPPLKNMTIDDYAKSDLIENNWLVRILSESMTGPIDMDNLEVAKEVLKRKFIVGLLDNKRGSFARFDHYFKWKESPQYEKEFGCRKQLMDEKYVSKHPIRKESDTWKLLLEQNRFDVHLYDYTKELFSQQSYIFGL